MSERSELLEVVAATIADYRTHELGPPSAEHVDRWVSQFAADIQVPLLWELWHVLEKTYFSSAKVIRFLEGLTESPDLVGPDAVGFWKSANFLSIQQNGHSQAELLKLFDEVLHARCGLRTDDCGSDDGPYIYLDDGVFSGTRVGNDLSAWITNGAPSKATVYIVAIATHTLGEWQASERLKSVADAARKNIDLRPWRAAVSYENRLKYRDSSEVLWPTDVPDDSALKAYMEQEEKYPFEPRKPGGKVKNDVFSSEEGRQLLERELLTAGVRIRARCQNPKTVIRPLGFSAFGLGFGSMIVTFRNCPNNAPLALWWGDPNAGPGHPLSAWYPLLPRKTYDVDVAVAEDAAIDGIPF